MSTFALKKCNGGHKQNLEKKPLTQKNDRLNNFDALLKSHLKRFKINCLNTVKTDENTKRLDSRKERARKNVHV